MNYTAGNLAFTKFYVSTTQSVGGTKTGTLTVTNGTVTKPVPLTANFIQLINFGKIILIITNTINLTIIISIFYLLNYL